VASFRVLQRQPPHVVGLSLRPMIGWCRLSRVETAFIDPGSPCRIGYSESFNGRFRDEFLTTEQFDPLLEAQVLARPAHRVKQLQTPRLITGSWITGPCGPSRAARPGRSEHDLRANLGRRKSCLLGGRRRLEQGCPGRTFCKGSA